jgi:hypothetical protein
MKATPGFCLVSPLECLNYARRIGVKLLVHTVQDDIVLAAGQRFALYFNYDSLDGSRHPHRA